MALMLLPLNVRGNGAIARRMHRERAECRWTRFAEVRFPSRFVRRITKNRAAARLFRVGTVGA
jgi:hypothetical protein